ncbi:MAG: hypothetical protein ACJAZD_002620, partial [Ilumatobacter sp.]
MLLEEWNNDTDQQREPSLTLVSGRSEWAVVELGGCQLGFDERCVAFVELGLACFDGFEEVNRDVGDLDLVLFFSS